MKAEIQGLLEISIKRYFIQESGRNHDDKAIDLMYLHYFLNVFFSITISYAGFKFCLHILQAHLEGKVSQIYYLGPSFYFMPKIGKHCEKNRKHFSK